MDEHPLARIWPSLNPRLRQAFAAAHAEFGRLSTAKATTALRSVDGVAARVLDGMAERTAVPGRFRVSESVGDALPSPLETSPCVGHAARALESRPGPYDDGDFLLALIRESTGATATRWKTDGFDADRVAELLEEARASDRDAASSE